jgi:hypothetical protein
VITFTDLLKRELETKMLNSVYTADKNGEINFYLLSNEFKYIILKKVYEECDYNIRKCAGFLHINITTLVQLLQRFDLYNYKKPPSKIVYKKSST